MVAKYVRGMVAGLMLCTFLPGAALGWNIFPSLGEQRTGTASMEFLKMGAGARAAAMGNSIAAASEDGFGVYWNPASMVWGAKREIALAHNMWVVDVNYEFAAYTIKLGEDRAVAASVVYLGTPDMEVTDEYHPFGTGETFGFADFAFGLSFAQRLTDYFSFGGTLKYAQENLENLRMHGVLLDLGTYYQTNFRGVRFAVTFSNFGQQVKPSGTYVYVNPAGERLSKSYQSFSPPTIFRIGMAMDFLSNDRSRWQGSVQLDHPTDNAEAISLGTEYMMNQTLFLRAGYKLNNDSQSYSLGVGLKVKLLATDGAVDYAFSSVGDLGYSNTVSLRWSF